MAQMTMAEMQAKLADMQKENERLRQEKAQSGKISFKVSVKGAVSVYGMGRFPITLYREQWERLLAHSGQIENFIATNAKLLSTKDAVKTKAEGTRVDMGTGKPEGDDVPMVA
jgi:hypothetical protein